MPLTFRSTLLSLALLSGCGEADEQTFLRVDTGMNSAQVHQLLGKPDHSSHGAVGAYIGVIEVWYTRDQTLTVQYLNNQVKLKTIAPRSTSTR